CPGSRAPRRPSRRRRSLPVASRSNIHAGPLTSAGPVTRITDRAEAGFGPPTSFSDPGSRYLLRSPRRPGRGLVRALALAAHRRRRMGLLAALRFRRFRCPPAGEDLWAVLTSP